MEVVSTCPLRVASIPWQQANGAWTQTVLCKATYLLEPTEARLAPTQEEPRAEDRHWDDDPRRSLFAPSDLVPFKARAEVVISGHVFAPERKPVRSLVARVIVGEIDKSVEVWCDRTMSPDAQIR